MANLFKSITVFGKEIYVVADTLMEAIQLSNKPLVSIDQITGLNEQSILVVAGD